MLALDADWVQSPLDTDDTMYYVGGFRKDAVVFRVVAAAAIDTGLAAATALSMKLITHFRPRYLAMTGIAAGVGGNYGDILIADQSWDYGSGKAVITPSGQQLFLPAPSAIPLSHGLKNRLQRFSLDHSVAEEIKARWTGPPSALDSIKVRMGPVASGAAVVADETIVDEIASHNRKLIGVEMETYGVFLAAAVCPAPRPEVMSIKGVSDFGGAGKGDEYQKYAAHMSANFLYEFCKKHLM